MRKGSMLEGMFLDIATPEEVAQLNRLLESKNYGGAETFVLRRIVPVWVKAINQLRLYR